MYLHSCVQSVRLLQPEASISNLIYVCIILVHRHKDDGVSRALLRIAIALIGRPITIESSADKAAMPIEVCIIRRRLLCENAEGNENCP